MNTEIVEDFVSCAKCGTVLDAETAPVDVRKTGGKEQRSIYCPVCSELVVRVIGDKNAPVAPGARADFRPADEIKAEAAVQAKLEALARAKVKAEAAVKAKADADAKTKVKP